MGSKFKELKHSIDYLNKSVFAGIMIGVGGVIYLRCPNKIIGAFLFSIGLLTIIIFNANLFTGKIGRAKLLDTWNMFLCLLGNFIGTNVIAFLIKQSRLYPDIYDSSSNVVSIKLLDSNISLLILGVLCGMLMYIAVESYNKHKDIIGISVAVICVATFILSGFEHCIADMFYFALEPQELHYVIKLLFIIIGNTIGAKLVYYYTLDNKF